MVKHTDTPTPSAPSDKPRTQRGALSAREAERLFATVDETGHSNEERARHQLRHRRRTGHGVDVDPLTGADPSGSNVEQLIMRTAVGFVLLFLVLVIVAQVSCGVARRVSTATLAEDVNLHTVAAALERGVEWGNGFTQFPVDYVVREADENTHRVVVTVTDTSSSDQLECFSNSQIQSSAFAVNALLNPNIDTVVYNVDVHVDAAGNIQQAALLGFLKPTGEVRRLMTFVWTKTTTEYGPRYDLTITGLDEATQEQLRERVTSAFTPGALLDYVTGGRQVELGARPGERAVGEALRQLAAAASDSRA